MESRQYEKLVVWQEAHQLCLKIYALTIQFPADEKFGLISQMRRSSYSIPTNLAEGNGRSSQKEKIHFLDIAIGSLEELHYQLILSRDLKYIRSELFDEFSKHLGRVGYLLNQLRQSLL